MTTGRVLHLVAVTIYWYVLAHQIFSELFSKALEQLELGLLKRQSDCGIESKTVADHMCIVGDLCNSILGGGYVKLEESVKPLLRKAEILNRNTPLALVSHFVVA